MSNLLFCMIASRYSFIIFLEDFFFLSFSIFFVDFCGSESRVKRMIYNMDVSWWFTYILLPQTKSEAIPKITRTSTGYTQSLCTFLLTHTAMCNGCLLELLVWWSCGLLVCTINRGERVLAVIKICIFLLGLFIQGFLQWIWGYPGEYVFYRYVYDF